MSLDVSPEVLAKRHRYDDVPDGAPPIVPFVGLDGPEVSRRRESLRFHTARELSALTLPEVDWIVHPGLLAIGAITEFDGKIKAAGKTTLLLHMVRAILDGADFLGQPTRKARVLYVTEQSRVTFVDALRLVGLEDRGDELRILLREDIHGMPWPELVGHCEQDDYEVVAFDTMSKLAGIREENDAGPWAAAMAPLQDLAASGRAVPIARHDRKGGGEVGESGRGSSQASGDVDIILGVRRPEGNQPRTRRVIESLSRFRETPDKFVIDLTDAGYVYLGSDEAVRASSAREFVSAAIDSEFRQTERGLTMAELVKRAEGEDPKIPRTLIQSALATLEAQGVMYQSGRGVAHDPFVYTPASSMSAVTQSSRAGRQETWLDGESA